MGSLQRITKNLLSMFFSNIVSILTELVLPAVFLRSYGKVGYADWLVLTAAVAYLSTLNFGMETFVNQDLAIRFNRGERESYHVAQSTALRALLGIVTVAGMLCLVIFALPVERFLNLSLSHLTASLALYFVALQVLVGALIFSYFAGNYMGVGLAHRGNNWNNAQRLGSATILTGLAWVHAPLFALAIAQFAWYLLLLTAMLIDLKIVARAIFPTLRYWDWPVLKAMLPASGYFGVIFWSTFLCYQLPIILLQRIVGPAPVVMLTLGRKIFGLGRQVLNGLTQSMAPEITRIFGAGNWPAMAKLYTYSERMIFALIAVVNLPLFIFSPLVLHVWLSTVHRGDLGVFSLTPFLLIAAINMALCVKEHKFQFQFSTNTHVALAKIMFFTYLTMSLLSLLTIRWYGLTGFLATWLVTELVQTVAIMQLNAALFAGHGQLRHHYAVRLALLATVGLTAGAVTIHATRNWGYWQQAGVDAAVIAPVLLVSFLAFDIRDLSSTMKSKVLTRFRTTPA